MEDVTLVVLDTSWCGYCKAMKKSGVVEKFSKAHPKVAVKELTLPDNWGDEDDEGLAPTKRRALLAGRTTTEKEAVRIAKDNDIQGVPFVGFFDAEGGLLVESDGAVGPKELEQLYKAAVAKLEDEDEGTVVDDTGEEEDEEDDT